MRNVASSIGQRHLQGAAVDYSRIQRQQERAICTHSASRQHIAGGITHLHRGTRFATACQLVASKADYQIHRCIRRRGIRRRFNIRGRNASSRRCIAGCVLCGHFQCLAIGLRWLQIDAELPVSTRHRAAQQYATRTSHRHRRAGFGAAGEGGALFVDGKIGRCQRCRCIRGGDAAGGRDVARTIGQGDFKVFAVDLRGIQRNVEAAIGTDRAAADQVARAVANIHRAAGFAAARQAQAIRGHQQVDRCGRRRGVAWVRATTAATAAVVGRRRRAANTQQAEPCNGPGRHRAARHSDTRDQFIQRGHFVESKARKSHRIVVRMPQGAVLTDEDDVAADAGLIHGEEVADSDLLARLQGDDQVLSALGDGCHFIGGNRHLHDAWPVETDIAPGTLGGDCGLLIGDDDVVHGCSLLVCGYTGSASANQGRRNVNATCCAQPRP
ncbi:hypothetical protein PPUJ20066_40980 [Pseudomonas putida]|nr:hypothetical protein PPUJ20066_40980 [Pseudomonas putida]